MHTTSPPTPYLPQRVRQLLAELELISHGSCQAWNSSGSRGEPQTILPHGESNPPHELLRAMYLSKTDDTARAEVVERMRAALRSARGHIDRSHVTGESREDEDARMIKQGEGFTAEEVANRFNCTPTRIRRVRLATGRRADDGTTTHAQQPDDARSEALRMKQQGMTERQIALALKQPKSTIHDWVKAA